LPFFFHHPLTYPPDVPAAEITHGQTLTANHASPRPITFHGPITKSPKSRTPLLLTHGTNLAPRRDSRITPVLLATTTHGRPCSSRRRTPLLLLAVTYPCCSRRRRTDAPAARDDERRPCPAPRRTAAPARVRLAVLPCDATLGRHTATPARVRLAVRAGCRLATSHGDPCSYRRRRTAAPSPRRLAIWPCDAARRRRSRVAPRLPSCPAARLWLRHFRSKKLHIRAPMDLRPPLADVSNRAPDISLAPTKRKRTGSMFLPDIWLNLMFLITLHGICM